MNEVKRRREEKGINAETTENTEKEKKDSAIEDGVLGFEYLGRQKTGGPRELVRTE